MRKLLLIIVSFLLFIPIGVNGATQFNITGPVGSEAFGLRVFSLPNGNIVVLDPFFDTGQVADVGAVYLYNGVTRELISTLTGSTAGDKISNNSINVLASGNFVVNSPDWDNGSAIDAGAATFVNGTTGLSGVVSSANSLVGSTTNDDIGGGFGIVALSNGNYVVNSWQWDNGGIVDAGAVIWGNGTTGVSGVISSANALIGERQNDRLSFFGVRALTNGNYVVSSSRWDNGTVVDAGAATFGSGTTGITGFVSPLNSLIGSTAGDGVGGQITPLTNGNYVVRSGWNNGSANNAGAVTFGDGQNGTVGVVSAANSLVGSTTSDNIGAVTVLNNGNYVVVSPGWDNGPVQDAGAATFGNGTTGVSGVISASNSLVGTTPSERVGDRITTLTNGNFVLRTINWDSATAFDVGAATWANGTTGIIGTISPSNSLIGSQNVDNVGLGVTALPNGNYVVWSQFWDNGPIASAGAVTWANGTTGITGVVSTSNSLVGSSPGDQVGFAQPLANGNYTVSSIFWDNGPIVNAGAMTWGNGTTGTTGVVSSANSLVGSAASDNVGGSSALTNGNYVVSTQFWNNGAVVDAGSAAWADGTIGITGVISSSNALVGGTASDQVTGGVPLTNGNYISGSSNWDNGSIVDAGAVIWGSGTSGITGSPSASNALVGSTSGDMVGSNGTVSLPNGDYVVSSPSWDNGSIVDAGAITYGNGSVGTRGSITFDNSVRGTTPGGGATLNFSYDSVYSQLIVGRPAENIVTVFRPTAESYSVSGRVVMPDGSGLRNAVVRLTASDGSSRTMLTSSFGYYTFDNVSAGAAYTIRVISKRYRFSARVVEVNDNLSGVDFVGNE